MKKLNHKYLSRPTASKNWGWCSENCYRGKEFHRPKTLQEVKVDVLTRNACRYLGRAENANPKLEMCAGRKTRYPVIETYIRLHHSGHTWYERKVRKHDLCVENEIIVILQIENILMIHIGNAVSTTIGKRSKLFFG